MSIRRSLFGLVCATLCFLSTSATASERFHQPTQGNQFVSTTDKYLYIVWSVPKDLAPFRGIASHAELDGFIARTALFLCHEHRASEPTQSKPCKVQVVRMNSNDEYTKSAAGGWKTIAELVLARTHASDEAWKAALGLSLEQLKARFTSFDVKHERIALPSAG